MTTLAPLPGRGAPNGIPAEAHLNPDAGVGLGLDLDAPPIVETDEPEVTVEVPVRGPAGPAAAPVVRSRVLPTDAAGQAAWLFGLAHALLSEGTAEQAIVTEVLAEAAGRSRAIEGAYGRAVALLSEFPADPLVHRTVDLLAKALLRSRRPARAEEA